MKIFISQPMRGLDIDDIKKDRATAQRMIEEYVKYISLTEKIEYLDNLQEDKDPETTHSLEYLGNDIMMLKNADIVFFIPGWDKSRGCNIEFQVCSLYGINMQFINACEFMKIRDTM